MKYISVFVFCLWFLATLPIILILGVFIIFPKIRNWMCLILLGIDQFGNVLLIGDPDETISSRLGRSKVAGGSPHWYIRALRILVDAGAEKLFNDHNHCESAIERWSDHHQEQWDWTTGEVKDYKKYLF